MELKVIKTCLADIEPLRVLFLQENNFEFIYNKCHLYGWADNYIFLLGSLKIGYGSVWGSRKREERDAIFEFYVLNPYRKLANECFLQLQIASGASFIECQTNDLLLSSMLFENAKDINAEAILFEDDFQTHYEKPHVIFQKKTDVPLREDDREYVLIEHNNPVATGGLMLNYNLPYADIYYEVNEPYRKKGFGTFMVQQLKKEAYHMGRVPAARCNIKNVISKSTLLKAGFKVCGCLLNGQINNKNLGPTLMHK